MKHSQDISVLKRQLAAMRTHTVSLLAESNKTDKLSLTPV